MDKKNDPNGLEPVTKKNPAEDALKKDSSTLALVKAIKTLLKKDKLN